MFLVYGVDKLCSRIMLCGNYSPTPWICKVVKVGVFEAFRDWCREWRALVKCKYRRYCAPECTNGFPLPSRASISCLANNAPTDTESLPLPSPIELVPETFIQNTELLLQWLWVSTARLNHIFFNSSPHCQRESNIDMPLTGGKWLHCHCGGKAATKYSLQIQEEC